MYRCCSRYVSSDRCRRSSAFASRAYEKDPTIDTTECISSYYSTFRRSSFENNVARHAVEEHLCLICNDYCHESSHSGLREHIQITLSSTDQKRSPEELSGIFSLSFFTWLIPLMRNGYRKLLTVEDLYPIDSKMSSKLLWTQIRRE